MTGWGQSGPLAKAAGHDMNYIALTGVLHSIGTKGGPPVPPLNLVGDFGGGGIYLAFGIVCALLETARSGRGQVVNAAMIDGASSLMTAIYGLHAAGKWNDERGTNILDSGAHFYQVYETKDGKYVSVASIEAKFYDELLDKAGLDKDAFAAQWEHQRWPEYTERMRAVFKTRTRDEWCAIMEGSDICFAPGAVHGRGAPAPPQRRARHLRRGRRCRAAGAGAALRAHAGRHPAPTTRAGRAHRRGPRDWGFGREEIAALRQAGGLA